jgi:DNA-binding transcriptional LysR family regulator
VQGADPPLAADRADRHSPEDQDMRTWLGVERRALLAAWRASPAWQRLAARRHVAVSAALVVAGLAGALAGGWLIGRWMLGLMLICESVGALWFGLNRDDGEPLPVRGARTVAQVLDDERARPDPDEVEAAGPGAWAE